MPYKVQLRYEDYEYEENGGNATKKDEHFSFALPEVGGVQAATEEARKQTDYDVDYVVRNDWVSPS